MPPLIVWLHLAACHILSLFNEQDTPDIAYDSQDGTQLTGDEKITDHMGS